MPQAQNDSSLPAGSREKVLLDLDRRFRQPLRAYFGRRISNAAEAEDLVQDVFERVLKCLGTGSIRNAEALLFRIAINLLRDRSRRVRRHGTEELLPEDSAATCPDPFIVDLTPERVVLGERALEDVLLALDELDGRTRSMFYLYRLENLKIREIAELYAITPSAVEKQVAKALGHLARRLYGHD